MSEYSSEKYHDVFIDTATDTYKFDGQKLEGFFSLDLHISYENPCERHVTIKYAVN